MAALRTLVCLAFLAAPALWSPVAAQVTSAGGATGAAVIDKPPHGAWLPGGRSYLGLNLARSRYNTACPTTALLCSGHQPVELYAGTMVGNFWGVEMGYANVSRTGQIGLPTRSQGLSLSLVGKAQLAPSLGVYGKLGTTYGRTESPASSAAAPTPGLDQGFGLSYGGGLSYEFTPRLSARLEWDSNDFRFAGTGREPVRSTSLGLQFRY